MRALPDTVSLAVLRAQEGKGAQGGQYFASPLPCWLSLPRAVGMWPRWGVPNGLWEAPSVWRVLVLGGGCGLPFTERHPPVVDADGAVPEASHDEGAVGVTGQACHTAVSARGDVLGPGTGTVVRLPHSFRARHHPWPGTPAFSTKGGIEGPGNPRDPQGTRVSQAHTRPRAGPLSLGPQPAHNSGNRLLVPIKLSSVSLFPKKEDEAHFGRDGSS